MSQITSNLTRSRSYFITIFYDDSERDSKAEGLKQFSTNASEQKHFQESAEPACEGLLPHSKAGWETTKKAFVESTFLQVHLIQQAISFASTAFNKKA